jgi:hypothetical protein
MRGCLILMPLSTIFNLSQVEACFFILKLVYGWKQPETCLNHEPQTCLRKIKKCNGWRTIFKRNFLVHRHVKNNACAVEIKIKWIKRKQMTHENTYRDDKEGKGLFPCNNSTKYYSNRPDGFVTSVKDVKVCFSRRKYQKQWTILFVMLKIYFIYKVAGKKSRRAI